MLALQIALGVALLLVILYWSQKETTYTLYSRMDSPGNDLISSIDPSNYGITLQQCKDRCTQQGSQCAGFGYDPQQNRAGKNGYCTSKAKVGTMVGWTGDFYKKSWW